MEQPVPEDAQPCIQALQRPAMGGRGWRRGQPGAHAEAAHLVGRLVDELRRQLVEHIAHEGVRARAKMVNRRLAVIAVASNGSALTASAASTAAAAAATTATAATAATG